MKLLAAALVLVALIGAGAYVYVKEHPPGPAMCYRVLNHDLTVPCTSPDAGDRLP